MIKLNSILKKRRFWQLCLGLLGSLCLILVFAAPQSPSLAVISEAKVKEIVDGDQVFIQANKAKVDDVAALQQIVSTEASRVSLLFNNGAAGRLGTNSSVTVGQCVEVEKGQLIVSGPANGCISGFAIGVQGTVYIVEKNEANPQEKGNIKVLEGKLYITKEGATDEKPLELEEGKKVSILISNELGRILNISSEEFASILTGQLFDGFQIPITQEGILRSACLRIFGSVLDCTSSGIPIPRTPSLPGPSIPGLPF